LALKPPVAMWETLRELIFWCRNTELDELKSGNGSPEGVVTGYVGDMYRRKDGGANTTLYVKESGAGTNTGWVAK
jgi:hypothetical protein